MKKYEIYIVEVLLFISIIMFNIIFKNVLFQNLAIVVLTVYLVSRFGMMKDNNYLKSTIVKMVVSCLIVYLLTIYMLGLIVGFNKTPVSLSLDYFIKVISLDALIIVSEEIMRYVIARNTQHKKLSLIIYTILLVILNIIIEIKGYDMRDSEMRFIFITTIALPTISIQAMCSYLTYKVSYLPSLIFNLVVSLYQYVIPIVPKLGNYLYATTSIALPYITYYTTSNLLHYKDKADVYKKKAVRRLVYVPVFIFLIIMVMLVSGICNHTMIAIGSNSMNPIYNRGDAIIYKKVDIKTLKEGDIIAFKKSNKIVTHRIIKIRQIDNSYVINTKGDANNTPDAWEVKDDEILGIVNYSIKYIGYPTLWFNEEFEGEETK